MTICTIEEFITLFFDKYGKYSFKDLDFDVESKWKELFEYCEANCDKDPELYSIISLLYRYGKYVDVNYKLAAESAQIGIDKGSILCLWRLGALYANGLYFEKSYEKAFEYYYKAASLGCIPCMYNVALYYKNGRGVEQSYEEAVKWWRLAAEQCDVKSQNNLACCYSSGYGVEKSYEEAIKYWRLAATQGEINAQFNLGVCYSQGCGVPQSYEEALKWYELAATQGFYPAQYNLGFYYNQGYGVAQSYKEAVKWYRLAADQGYARAQYNLGFYYSKGYGVAQSYEEAVKWYELAATQGHVAAQNNLGNCYYDGNGVLQSYEEAIKWYKLSADQGCSTAYVNLVFMYNNGEGVSKDYIQALIYAQKAYDLGYEEIKELLEELKEKVNSINESNVINYGNLKLGNRKDVFISWNHNDKQIKDDLVLKLNELGFNSCFDSDGDGHGELLPVLKDAIMNSKASIVIVTKNSILSPWVKQEVEEMLKKASIDPVYKESIKPILISDSSGDIVDLINNIEDKNSPFKKLLELGGQFETLDSGINVNNIKSFIIQAIDKTLKLQYKEKVLSVFNSFSTALKNTYSSQDTTTGIISAMVDFDRGYIERYVYQNGKSFSLGDILNVKGPVLIYGEGGCGKSLYLKNITRKAFENDNFIFYLESKKLIDVLDKSFLYILKSKSFDNYYPDYHDYVTIESFENILINKNNIYILIDALDEMSFEERNLLFERLKEFKTKYSNLHFIFTSRNVSDSVDIGKAFSLDSNCYELKGLTDSEVEKLYINIFQNYKQKESKILDINEKNSNDFVRRIIDIDDEIKRNPLLLSNLIFIYLLSNEFPNTKYELINKTVDIMITDIEEDRCIAFKYKDFLTGDNLTKLLCDLAYSRASNDNSPIVEIFKETIKDIDSSLDSSTMANEIYRYLKNRAIITDSGLSHEIFKDYFAATSLYNDIYEFGRIKKKRRVVFKEDGFDNLKEFSDDFINQDNPWPGISCNFISKLDFNVKNTNDNECNEAFVTTINYLIGEGNISNKAIDILKYLIERRSLYFYQYLHEIIKNGE